MRVEMTNVEAVKMIEYLEFEETALAIKTWAYKNPNKAMKILKEIRSGNS